MGFLQRLFGIKKPQGQQQTAQVSQVVAEKAAASSGGQTIPPERIGLDGEYDESGLAKRVALAFDEDPVLENVDSLYVAQTGGTVVLKGKVPSQEILSKMASVAKSVRGATAVDTSQVTIG